MLRGNIGNNCLKFPPEMTILPPNNKSSYLLVLSMISKVYREAIGASIQTNISA